MAHSSEIDAGVYGAVKFALLRGLEWYAVIILSVTVLFTIWFICYSDRVEFTDSAILYYRYIFSKKSRVVPYNQITECVFNDGFWLPKGECVSGRKILFYNKNDVILYLDLYYKLCLSVLLNLSEKKVWLVDDDTEKLETINNYFKIDFMNLSSEHQLKILRYYCKLTRTKYKTGEEILFKK